MQALIKKNSQRAMGTKCAFQLNSCKFFLKKKNKSKTYIKTKKSIVLLIFTFSKVIVKVISKKVQGS